MHLPDFREKHKSTRRRGLILFGSGVALLSYVLEVFGEHTLKTSEIAGLLAISILLLTGYGVHASRTAHPMLDLILFRIRTFRASVVGSFVTRLGIGGIPFLFPLLYQVGLGFTPIQSGLMMMPQAIAAITLKPTMPKILARFGYRAVLISNTLIIGALILLFATIGKSTPLWLVVVEMFVLRILHLAAIHLHEHARLRRRNHRARKQRQFHRQHRATNGRQLRRCHRLAGHSIFPSRRNIFPIQRNSFTAFTEHSSCLAA